MTSVQNELPKLLYIGDVPVEESFAGSTLLYRLLSDYPPERLLILESNMQAGETGRRLPGVRYEQFKVGWPRLLRTRFRPTYASLLAATAPWKQSRLSSLIGQFQPEAVLTVAHGFSWMAARRFAGNRIPLHMIVHDDLSVASSVSQWYRSRLVRQFGQTYKAAAECYCISTTMRDAYTSEFDRAGQTMPPSRRDETLTYDSPAGPRDRPLTFGYAGTLYIPGYRELLVRLIREMPEDCRCIVYALDARSAIPASLHDRVIIRDPVPPNQLNSALRDDVDVLFCPSSFDSNHRRAVKLNFPSKLVEYTSVGLPLLVWGPPDSSPVRWSDGNGDPALVVRDKTSESLRLAIETLRDTNMRRNLAERAMEVGRTQFSPSHVRGVFHTGLREAQISWNRRSLENDADQSPEPASVNTSATL